MEAVGYFVTVFVITIVPNIANRLGCYRGAFRIWELTHIVGELLPRSEASFLEDEDCSY